MKKIKHFRHQAPARSVYDTVVAGGSSISHQLGFTMIELLVVATIIIILTTIGLASFQQASKNARNGKRKADIEAVRSALVLFRTDTGAYPIASGVGAWTTMMTAIANYTSNDTVDDPKNTGVYVYTYSSTGPDFTLCAKLEPDPGTDYCVTNP